MANKGVSNNSFSGQTTITSAHFGRQCVYIGENAFDGCTSLSQINEDNVLEIINKCGFKQTKLESAIFSKLTDVGNEAFSECIHLNNVSIPNCKTIPSSTFSGCVSLINVNTKPHTVGSKAFYKCDNLSKIDLSECTEISDEAFKECKKIQELNLPECTVIKNGAFFDCSNLRKISLYKCNKIHENAFNGCQNLRAVYIHNTPDCFCNISQNVFCGCEDVTTPCSESIYFYIDKNVIEDYKNDIYWSHYATNMLPFVEENQIFYRTNNNERVSDTWENYIEINNHEYSNTHGIIDFASTVDRLCENMFKDADNLTSIDISSKCKIIEKNAFENCYNLNTINFDVVDGIVQIDDYAFKNCESLLSFEIPQSAEKIGEGVFAGCKNIEKFEGKFATYNGKAIVCENKLICVLPKDNSITEGRIHKTSDIDSKLSILGKSCFYGCENMRRVDISSNVKEIHDNAFDGCINLCEIHILSKEPPVLGKDILNGVREDVKIFVPEDSLSSYISQWSQYSSKIYPIPSNNSIIYYGSKIEYIPNQTEISIDDYGIYWKISGIGESLQSYFTEQKSVRKVILGEGITKLNTNAFKNCTNLDYIYISDSVKTFGDGCFNGCRSLNRIHIPSNLTESEYNIFDGCTNLKEFGTYYKGYVSDDNRCYIKNNILKFFAQSGVDNSYSIPNNITEIASFAFKGCSLKNIKISKKTKKIGTSAFEGCNRLNKISNFTGVEYINNSAFRDCIELENINLSNSLESIGDYAFYNCKKYKGGLINNFDSDSDSDLGTSEYDSHIEQYNYFFMPDSIKNLGSNCFKNTGLENLYIYETSNLTTLPESAFEGCSSMNYISIDKSNIKSIEKNAFKNCGINIEKLVLPNNIESIKDGAFENCTIGEIRLPNSLSFLGNTCFNRVENIYIEKFNTTPPEFTTSGAKPFSDSVCIYIYGNDSYKAYSTNKYWEKYMRNIERMSGNAKINFVHNGCDEGLQYEIKELDNNNTIINNYNANSNTFIGEITTWDVSENHIIRIYPGNSMTINKNIKITVECSDFNSNALPTINSDSGYGYGNTVVEIILYGDIHVGEQWISISFENDNKFNDTDGYIYVTVELH